VEPTKSGQLDEDCRVGSARVPGRLVEWLAAGVGHASAVRPDPSTLGVVGERGCHHESCSQLVPSPAGQPLRRTGQVALVGDERSFTLWSWPGGSGAWPMACVGLGRVHGRYQGLSCPTICLEGRELDGRYGCRAVASVDFVALPSG
jgi:hypothetical protein